MKNEPEESPTENNDSPKDEAPEPKPATPDDPAVDSAVDSIMKEESDAVLVAEDTKHFEPPKRPWYKRFLANKKFSIPTAIMLVLIILATVPWTRYKLAGLVWKQTFTITVIDTQTKQPVSEAIVSLAGKALTSDNQGKAVAKVRVGSDKLSISKQYYQSFTGSVLVPIMKQKAPFIVYVQATGRQVPLTVIDKISGAAIGNVLVKAASAQARTDKNGTVTIVLPADKATIPATLSGDGFNQLTATIHITTANDPVNKFPLTPAGKVYFLSNLSGKIDVVKTNLDGTERQTVLAGTGKEDTQNTVLLASRDWKYLALLAHRSGTLAELDLIDTSSDQLLNIDQGNASFTLVGWSNDKFIYQVDRNTISNWQPGQQVLKSFDAPSKKLTTLDQTTANGTSDSDNVRQQFGSEYIVGSSVVYVKNWYAAYNLTNMQQLAGDQATLNSISNDGGGQKVIKTFALDPGIQTNNISLNTRAYDPGGLYIQFSSGSTSSLYEYTGGQVKPAPSSVTDTTFYQTSYPTYLLSPSANQTFWAEPRDGKNTLFTGDEDAGSPKQIAALSEYTTYGWYSDNYLLVQKGGSELFIMPATGGTPLKLSDYYKPSQNFNGYGGGYGGL